MKHSAEDVFTRIDSYSFINELIQEKTSITKRLRTGDTFVIADTTYELTKLSLHRYGVKNTATSTEFSEVEFAAQISNCTVEEILSSIVEKRKTIFTNDENLTTQQQLSFTDAKDKINFVDFALNYLTETLSVIPVKSDKTPSVFTWKEFQTTLPTKKQIEINFNHNTFGIAIICGSISGGLEIIDVDCKYDLTGKLYDDFKTLINELAPGLFEKLVIEKTVSGGYHLIYRCMKISGNLKLASRLSTTEEIMKKSKEKQKGLIETRGEGGYFVCAPTPGYSLIQCSFNQIPQLTEEERDTLISAAQTFNQVLPVYSEAKPKKPFISNGLSPFEDYNKRGDCIALLQTHGWSVVNENSEKVILKRPGDTKAKHSAYFTKAKNWFSVFSTSTEFEIQKAYLPYAVFAMLECNGDFSEASKKLYELGYGERRINYNTANDSDPKDEEEVQQEFSDQLMKTPLIPAEVYAALPSVLDRACRVFPTDREKDILLTSAITILSGCFTNVSGVYDGRTVYPNLNCFIIAPPASGKNALSSARDLGSAQHRKLYQGSKEAEQAYQIQLQEYKVELRSSKGNPTPEPPVEPALKLLYIPANSSSASVIQSLESCDGKGIICETEADTLGVVLKQDWGGYSEMIRKAFHHEPITYKRKTNKEYVEIPCPKITVALSGTPAQVLNLIPSAEDGLFSRFIFYIFKVENKWRDVSPFSGRINLTDHFAQLAEEVKTMIEFVESAPITFNLTQQQWNELNRLFSIWLDEISTFVSEDAGSTVKRLSVIVFRIAMVLTALRKCEDAVADTNLTCTDEDFNTALKLAEVYKHHAMVMFKNLPKGSVFKLSSDRQKFFDALPDEFSRQEAVAVGASLNIKSRTVGKYLKIFLDKLIEKPVYGRYKKL